MPPSSSTKKVAKAARSSGRRTRPGQGRSLGYPIAIAMIVLLGTLVIFFGRDRRVSAANALPRLGVEHWHAAFGIYTCDTNPDSTAGPAFQPNVTDLRGDARGVHTHEDGIIHIHPFSSVAAGEKSNLGDFLYETKVEVTNSKIVLPGTSGTFENGQLCDDGQPGKVVLAEWKDANEDVPPKLIYKDIAGARFTNDRMAFTLAFVPEGTEIPKPDSVPTLDNLSDVDPTSTTTSAPTGDGATTTTAVGDTTTTVAATTSTSGG